MPTNKQQFDLNDRSVIWQFRYFEDNDQVVKVCQGWSEWTQINTPGMLEEIRAYIAQGKNKYQIRRLETTHVEGYIPKVIEIAQLQARGVRFFGDPFQTTTAARDDHAVVS